MRHRWLEQLRRRPRSRAWAEEAEPRLLFSADAVGGLVAIGPAPALDSPAAIVRMVEAEGATRAVEAVSRPHELVVVDAAVPDAQRLVEAIATQRPDAALTIVQLEPGGDPLAQVADALAALPGVSALHVVAHGEPGTIRLGDARLDMATLDASRDTLAAWGAALTADADLLLYGCDVASSAEGLALLDRLAELTGADVAASVDATGTADLGGDWQLEARSGQIETAALFGLADPVGWSGLLDTVNDPPLLGTAIDTSAVALAVGAGDADARSVLVRGDGSLLLVGTAVASGGEAVFTVTALEADGSVIDGFGTQGSVQVSLGDPGADATVARAALQADGRIVIAGTVQDGGRNVFGVVRLNADGSLDTGFGTGGQVLQAVGGDVDQVGDLVIAADGAITVVGGSRDDAADATYSAIRLTSAGVLDSGFGAGGIVRFTVGSTGADVGMAVALTPTGRIVIGGQSFNAGGASNMSVAVLRDSGAFYDSFSDNGRHVVFINPHGGAVANDVVVQADGRIVLAGTASNGTDQDFAIVRLDGTAVAGDELHVAFGSNGIRTLDLGGDDAAHAVAIQADGSLLVAGESRIAGVARYAVVRLTAGGDLDPTFGSGGIATLSIGPSDDLALSLALQSDGRILVSGTTDLLGRQRVSAVRLLADGSVDPSFGATVASGLSGAAVHVEGGAAVAIEPDAELHDPELAALAAGAGNYAGARIELARSSGAVAQDAFDALGNLSFTGGTLSLSGVTLGTVSQSAGRLELSLLEPTTQAQVNEVVSSIGYRYVGDDPPASIDLTWSLGDGNSGSQGTGGEGLSTATSTVTIVPVDDAPVIVSDGGGATATLSRPEGATLVTTVTANDVDGPSVGYEIAGGADATLFTIDAASGMLSFLAPPDAEAPGDADGNRVYEVLVAARSGALTDTQSITVTVGDVDEFDVTTPTDADANRNAVTESATQGSLLAIVAPGTLVGVTAAATDADASTNAITWSLDDDAGGRFAIDAASGVVSVDRGELLDREVAASHTITVRATSADGSSDTQVFTIEIDDVDEQNVTVPVDADPTRDAVAENAATGTTVGVTASATDPDATTNAITWALTDDAGGRFAIHATTGVVTVANGSRLDREAAASHTITVRATSADGSTSQASFTIAIDDVDESDVGPPADVDPALDAVIENAANGTPVGLTVSATDADPSATVAYTLVDDAGGRFAIDPVTGVVTVADGTRLDRETAASHTVTVRATSTDGSTSQADFTIALDDADEFDVSLPVDADATRNAALEGAATGTTVGVTASASDADATTNTITWSLDDDAGGRFAIHATTGVVTVADGSLIDKDTSASHTITVRATSADGSTSTRAFEIDVDRADAFDVTVPVDADPARDAVAENAANGSLVGVTASAIDADPGSTVGYALVDDAWGRFTIDPVTGVVTVANGSLLDREAAASHAITVRATSDDGSTSTQVFTIALDDVDEFDVTTPTDTDAARNAVAEGAANGTAVGVTASAIDADATTSAITWSLVGDAGGRFAIDAATGVVTVANGALLDRETAVSHTITVRATSADGSVSQTTFTIQLDDVDEFDVTTPTDTDAARNAVAENAANGTTVGVTASAIDADATTNAITWSLLDDAGGRFAIDAATGVVTVANGALLDREAAVSHTITVRATSADGSVSQTSFTIQLDDVDEYDVTPPTDADATRNAVVENAANGTTVGVTASAIDADATTSAITWSLVDDVGGRFAIDAATGVVTVANGALLDREAAVSHTITVRATSADGSTSQTSFTIQLDDVDEFDVTPPTDTDAARNAVAENAANGTSAGVTASAIDADATTNAITWSLADDAGGRFAIDAASGAVSVANGALLDREAAASHTITVRATSADGSTSQTSFTIQLDDVDEFDVTPPTDADATRNAVAESAANGTTVGVTASAIDADATTSAITWSLVDDVGGRFAIDAATGVVTVANGALLDREAAVSHTITVRATSADGSVSQTSFTIQLDDVDEFDVTPPTDADATRNAVVENAANGTTVGVTASAIDADATTSAITWSLADDAGGRFAIDAATGVVTVANGTLLDRETAVSHTITVRATSADGSTSQTSFTIQLDDVDEFDVTTPTDTDATPNAVAENAANATSVGVTASAIDADATTNAITWSLLDDAGGRFAIDAATGVVTVANGALLDRETAVSHTITVRATSADGSTSQTSFTIQLDDVEEPLVLMSHGGAADVDIEVDENVTAVTTVIAVDPDGGTIVYQIAGGADAARFSVDSATGALAFLVAPDHEAPNDANADNVYEVTVEASDGTGSVTQTFTVTVADVGGIVVDTTDDLVDGDTSSLAALRANPGADGAVSLREALLAANATPNLDGIDRIRFDLPGSGPATITPGSALPTITDTVFIDGRSDPDFVDGGAPVVILDGNGLTSDGLVLGPGADGSTIAGLSIRDFDGHGIVIEAGSDGNRIVGNRIGGLDPDGAALAGEENERAGIRVRGASNVIGGATAADGNLVSGNAGPGISMLGSAATGNTVIGNRIGVAADGVTAVGNGGIGIDVVEGATGQRIGGTGAGEGNLIAYSGAAGVRVGGAVAAASASILGNRIFDNAGLAIDLTPASGTSGVTANDPGDADTGGNGLLNFPVLTSVQRTAMGVLIEGSLTAAAGASYRIEFWSAVTGDPTGHGEAMNFVGATTVSGGGDMPFSVWLDGAAVSAEHVVSPTATVVIGPDLYGATSEFGPNVVVVSANSAPVLGVGAPMTFAPVTEDEVGNAGQTVASVIASAGGDPITDPDAGALEGIAVFAVQQGADGGRFEYSIDAGATWQSVGTVSSGSALLLRDTDRLRFVPGARSAETGSIDFRAWDRTYGTAGARVDVSVVGGTTALSVANTTATIATSAVNDAPTVVTVPASASTTTGTPVVFSTAQGNAISVADVDVGAGSVRVTLTAQDGTLTLGSTAGLSFVTGDGSADATVVFDGTLAQVNAALQGLSFAPTAGFGGLARLNVQVDDRQSGAGGPGIATATVPIGVGGDAFLQGDVLEVGLDRWGSIGSTGNAPAGFVNAGATLGVVADRQRDGWSTYDGDFITPGAPYEAWGLNVGGSTVVNGHASGSILGGTGAVQDDGTVARVDWTGQTPSLAIQQRVSVGASDLYADIVVTLTNTTGGALSDVYYFRAVDPDNNHRTGGTFTTVNTVVSQGGATGVAIVTASQADGSQMNVVGYGADARVAIGSVAGDPVGAWNGSAFTVSGSKTSDDRLGVVFRIPTLAAGESVTLQMRYEFAAASAPIVDLDANDSGASGGGFRSDFVEGGARAPIADTDARITDLDSTNLTRMTLSLAARPDGAAESLSANTGSTPITASYSAGTLTLTGTASVAQYQQVLRTVTYDNTSQAPTEGDRTIRVTAFDGVNESSEVVATVTVSGVNDAPRFVGAAASITFTEGGPPAALNSSFATLADAELDAAAGGIGDYSGASLTLSRQGGANASDVFTATGTLQFTGGQAVLGGVVVGTVTQADGLLRIDFNAQATSSRVDTVLASLAYSHTGDAPPASVRLEARFDDGNTDARQGSGGPASVTGTADVTIVPVDDAPVIVSHSGSVSVATAYLENSLTAVSTVSATDVDGPAITYAIAGGADAAAFTVDEASGALRFVQAPDFELPADVDGNNIYEVVVEARSGGLSDAQSFSVNVFDVDEFDVTVPSDTDATRDAVAENAANGASVGVTASAIDADATTNAIAWSLLDDAGGRFAIDAASGAVSVANGALLDREAAASHTITVRATSADGSVSQATFTIALDDVDEYDVTPPLSTDGTRDAVAENASSGAPVGITASASDADATNNAITWSLDDDAGGRFAIDAATGVVTVADGSLIDREAADLHSISVRATSSDGSSRTRMFIIAVDDVDEFDVTTPTDTDATRNAVAENAANGTAVGVTASAIDADATTNAITWSLTDDVGGRFAIDAATGVVTVANGTLLDRESAASHTITVRATSADGSTSQTSFTIQLDDVDELDVTVPTDIDATRDAVAENVANGTSVGVTASAIDADATTNAVTWSLADDAGGRFAIDAATGVVTVANGALLDRETAVSHTITVRATSADGSTSQTSFTIQLDDVDEFGVTTPTDVDATRNAVAENAATGTAVGVTASAADADATTNAVTWSLADDAGGRFAIDAVTGVVTVADGTLLDREAAASHDITIRAASTDGSTGTRTVTIALDDVDEFDVGVPVDADGARDAVAENAPEGTVAGVSARAVDPDATGTVSYALLDDGGGRFAIGSVTGVVTVANGSLLDREAAASHTITVQATSSDGSTSTRTFTIAVDDVDEFDVTAPTDSDGARDAVAENAAPGTAVGIVASAADADATTNTITWSLADDAGGRFAIDAVTGVVTVANGTRLDREAAASHDITIRATSTDGSTGTRVVTIALDDVDEFDVGLPADSDPAGDAVAENASAGTPVGLVVRASDADATASVSYTLIDDAGGRFAIDAASGAVTVTDGALLDREIDVDHTIVVRATSSDGSISERAFTIALQDVDEFDVGELSDTDPTGEAVDEHAAAGTAVGLVLRATDADATAVVSYVLVDDADGRFAIDAASGEVTVADAARVDRETAASHTIRVRATSSDGSSSERSFTIDLRPLDDNAPEFDLAMPRAIDVRENGTEVLVLRASDADVPARAPTFAIVGGADRDRFRVDALTGRLSLVAAPDFEAPDDADRNGVYEVSVAALDTAHETVTVLTVRVIDVAERPTLSVPPALQVTEDTLLRIPGLRLGDPDRDVTTVVLSVGRGRLEVDASDGARIDAIADGGASLTLVGTHDALVAALGTVRWRPDLNQDSADTLSIVAIDTVGLRASGSVRLEVMPVNDAPVIAAPARASIDEDAVLVLGPGGAGRIVLDDVDDAGPIRLSLALDAGTLTLATTEGLRFLVGDGAGDSTLVVTGTRERLQAALDGLVLTPPRDFHGAIALDALLEDPSGAVGQARLPIVVSSVDDPADAVVPPSVAVRADEELRFDGEDGRRMSVTDVDGPMAAVSIRLSVPFGTLSVAVAPGVSVARLPVDGTGDGLVLSGPRDAVNAVLATLAYRSAGGWWGSTELSILVRSEDAPLGEGGVTRSVPIDVSPVRVPTPVLSTPATASDGPTRALPIAPAGTDNEGAMREDDGSNPAGGSTSSFGRMLLRVRMMPVEPRAAVDPMPVVLPGDAAAGEPTAVRAVHAAEPDRIGREPAGDGATASVERLAVQLGTALSAQAGSGGTDRGSRGSIDEALDPTAVLGQAPVREVTVPEITLERGVRLAGVALTAGSVWWALSGSATLWILLAAGPLARTFDPLPALLRDDRDVPKDAAEELFDRNGDDSGPERGRAGAAGLRSSVPLWEPA